MIDRIEIKGYKSIKDVTVPLAPINILIGANGSGKSNFLSFFELINKLYDQKLKSYIALGSGIEKTLHNGSKVTQNIYSKIKFGHNAYSFEITKVENNFVFVSEGLWYDGNPYVKNPVDISDFNNEANIKFYTLPRAYYTREYLDSIKKYHFHDTGKNSPFTATSHTGNDVYFLYEKGENLAAYLYYIKEKHPKDYAIIVKVIRSVAPYFSDFLLQPNDDGYLTLQWQDKFSSLVYGVNDLSDGTMRFIALTTLFMQPKPPSSIIIDEPELGLHPYAIAKLAGMISSVAAKGCQVIVATQSTDLLSHFQPEDIITVDQENGESKFNRLKREELAVWLEDYTIDDLWKRSIITGGQPR